MIIHTPSLSSLNTHCNRSAAHRGVIRPNNASFRPSPHTTSFVFNSFSHLESLRFSICSIEGSKPPSSSPPPAPPAAAKKKTIFPKGAHQRDFRVWLDREKGNKVVTRITEVNGWRLPPGKEEFLKEISKALKQKCGAGGAVKLDSMEVLVQGDHREAVLKALTEWGHVAKKSGG